MAVLFNDKTGTLTKNELRVQSVHALENATRAQVLAIAAPASDTSTQDPLDLATTAEAATSGTTLPARISFTLFDPSTKRSEATCANIHRELGRAIKGSPQVLTELVKETAESDNLEPILTELAHTGARVRGVAGGAEQGMRILGVIGHSSPMCDDASTILHQLRDPRITVKMVTGDTPETAATVARELDLDGKVCGPSSSDTDCTIFAGLFPEDTCQLVRDHRLTSTIVVMTGDGVNDAPALRQAEVSIAVASATDVAKASASIVLTDPGLVGLVEAIRTGREVYQRVFTYTLNKIVRRSK